jgi:hypothetical protein
MRFFILNPFSDEKLLLRINWGVAQLAEQVTVNHLVGGSSPLTPANSKGHYLLRWWPFCFNANLVICKKGH